LGGRNPPPPPAADVADSAFDAIAKAAAVAQDAADQASAAAAAIAIKGTVVTKAAAASTAATAAAWTFQLPQMNPLVVGAGGGASFGGGLPSVSSRLPFQVDPTRVDPNYNFDASARARENLAIMRSNFLDGMKGITGAIDGTSSFSYKSVLDDVSKVVEGEGGSGSMNAAAAAAAAASTLTAVISSLHLKEYGGWYTAAFIGAYALTQRSAGRSEAAAEYQSELAAAKERASEAAAAAGLAAEGAMTAKTMAMRLERDMKKDGGKALLASSRSKMAEVEKASVFFHHILLLFYYPCVYTPRCIHCVTNSRGGTHRLTTMQVMMEKEMRALQAEVATLRSRIDKTEGGGTKKKITKSTTAIKTEIEEEYPNKVVMESDPDEDRRIIEILKLLDEENASKKMKAEEEARFVASEKTKAETATKAAAEAEDFAIRAAAEAKAARAAKKKAEEKLLAEKEAATAANLAEEKLLAEKEAAANLAEEKLLVEKEAAAAANLAEEKLLAEEEAAAAAAKKAEEKMLEDLVAAADKAESKKMTKGVETAQAKAEVAKKAIAKKATKKSDAKAKAMSTAKSPAKKATAGDAEDWSTLAESTLKRKSVAQITDYLAGKGASVTHSDGKPMNKAELLEAVKGLKISV
jgi:hypothetical protein